MPVESPDPFRWYDAKLLLLKMKRYEHVAERVEQFERDTGARAEFWREKFRASYREIIGVDPDRREELRARIEDIVDRKDRLRSVTDIIAQIDQSNPPSNGSGSAEAASTFGGVTWVTAGEAMGSE